MSIDVLYKWDKTASWNNPLF